MDGKLSIISAGQAGFIFKNGQGSSVGIDLYLSDCVEPLEGHIGYKRLLPKLFDPKDLDLDIVIATHPHLDHYDKDSIPTLLKEGRTKLIASVRCASLVKEAGIADNVVTYVRPGDAIERDGIRINIVDCDHGEGAPDAVGIVMEIAGRTIYETGDTCLRLDIAKDILERFGHIDVLIAPINGAYGNMNESDCVELAMTLDPDIVIPCHFGMFASHGGDPGRFLELMAQNGMKDKVMFMYMGEELTL